MAAYWVVFVAAVCISGGGYSAPCEPVKVEEIQPCGSPVIGPPPVAVAPCDADGNPIVIPTLSFPIPAPPPFPPSSIFALLQNAQKGDPNEVLSQVSKFLASALPCPHLQAAASSQPPPQDPCDDLVVEPPCNLPVPVASPCNYPVLSQVAPPRIIPAPIASPCNPPVPVPVASPCNPPVVAPCLPPVATVPIAPPCDIPAPVVPPCKVPAPVVSPCKVPAPVVSPYKIHTPVAPRRINPAPIAPPCNPPVITPCPPPVVTAPCDEDDKPFVMPTLSFQIPSPSSYPSSSIFSVLQQVQNGDPNDVLSQISKFLASTLPCPQLQAAACTQPPQVPCDEPMVAPPCNPSVPVPLPCNYPVSAPVGPPFNPLGPTPCNYPTTQAAPPCNPLAPVPVSPWDPPAPFLVSAPCKNPSSPIVPAPTFQTPVNYLGLPPTYRTTAHSKTEPFVNFQHFFPTESAATGCGEPLDSASLVILAAQQQQANLGLSPLPAETAAHLEVAPCSPVVTAPGSVDAGSVFEFPQFGQVTSRFLHPWGKMHDCRRRIF